MYTISKQFTFSASHILHGLPDGHPCSRLHGHNYTVELVLSAGKLDATGFILDYNDFAPFEAILRDRFDHRHLNDVVEMQPSAENLARWFFREAKALWPQTAAVRVGETAKTWAEYREG